MTQSPWPEIERHPFVADFRPEHQARLAALAKEVRFHANQVIFREGDDYSILYLLGTGMVALELDVPGHVLRVQTIYAGEVFDWSALLPHAGKHFQARALDPSPRWPSRATSCSLASSQRSGIRPGLHASSHGGSVGAAARRGCNCSTCIRR